MRAVLESFKVLFFTILNTVHCPGLNRRRRSEDVERKNKKESPCFPLTLPPMSLYSPNSPQKSPQKSPSKSPSKSPNRKNSRRKSSSITSLPLMLPGFLGARRKVRNEEKLRDGPGLPQVRVQIA